MLDFYFYSDYALLKINRFFDVFILCISAEDFEGTVSKTLRHFIIVSAVLFSLYGFGRLYYRLTDGFSIGNISSDFAFRPELEVEPLSGDQEAELIDALNRSYRYLGKGCQSYVFVGDDGKYVIKLFKYQRYRLLPWLAYFPPLPAMTKYKEQKLKIKNLELEKFLTSWKIACDHFKEEAGLLYVHLNKTTSLGKSLTIYDKLGFKHVLDLDRTEFCIQKRVRTVKEALSDYKQSGDLESARDLLSRMIEMIVSECSRGIVDNDQAFMQNTGVAGGKPVHIDVGQFGFDESYKTPAACGQELFTKMFHLRNWLRDFDPELYDFLDRQLREAIGPEYDTMEPRWRRSRNKYLLF